MGRFANGVPTVVVNTLSIGLVAALALGLSFGLGGKKAAAKLTEQWMRQARRAAQPSAAVNGVKPEGRVGAARSYSE